MKKTNIMKNNEKNSFWVTKTYSSSVTNPCSYMKKFFLLKNAKITKLITERFYDSSHDI